MSRAKSVHRELTPGPERELMLHAMRLTSDSFYAMAVRINNHPFIEFAGLMNEYIKCCHAAQKRGIDFTACNAHSGQHLPMADYEVAYVNEKLECIYGGRVALRRDGK